MAIVIREMRPDDCGQVAEFVQATESEDSTHARTGYSNTLSAASPDQIVRLLQRWPYLSLVAHEDGRIVGMILYGEQGGRGRFHALTVAPEYRDHALAQQLAGRAVAKLASRGIYKCRIELDQGGEAQHLWQAVRWRGQGIADPHAASAEPEAIPSLHAA